jgi:hypothetical protein
MADVRWHFFDVRCKMTVKSSGADHKNLKSETTPLISGIRGILSGAPNIVLGNFCCTDHSTGRDRSPSPHTGVFVELGKHTDRRPFRRGFLVPLPPGERIEIIPGNGEKRYRAGTENESRLPPTSDHPTPGLPVLRLRGPPIPVGRSLPEGKKPRVEDRRRCPEKARVPPRGFPKPPFRRER